ncbi:MAG: DUF763 domain-containing protein [Candidatus Levybacteria bacterium]|nr:DUF763 domain-containing protein [Candidatus Levybacteria bacterium]
MRRGIATFTLDYGKCPPWLFERMVKLGRAMVEVLIDEYGPDEFIRRIADPVWFQTLGTVLAFDWNASGLTTVLTGALKEAIRGQERDLGIFMAGGKGKTSRKTPDQILGWSERLNFRPTQANTLVRSSKLAAKVDSSLVQDGYQLYHHVFFFSKNGAWAVVQQGMNTKTSSARRYHWFEEGSDPKNFVEEPHSGISSQVFYNRVLNLVAKSSNKTRDTSVELVKNNINSLLKDIEIISSYSSPLSQSLRMKRGKEQMTLLKLERTEFTYHPVLQEEFQKSKYLQKILNRLKEISPKNYEELIATEGVGPKTIRALALVAEVIYGAVPSYEDPARFSFAHGGKDATPYPVDTQTYDKTIETIRSAVRKSRMNPIDKDKALARVSNLNS